MDCRPLEPGTGTTPTLQPRRPRYASANDSNCCVVACRRRLAHPPDDSRCQPGAEGGTEWGGQALRACSGHRVSGIPGILEAAPGPGPPAEIPCPQRPGRVEAFPPGPGERHG